MSKRKRWHKAPPKLNAEEQRAMVRAMVASVLGSAMLDSLESAHDQARPERCDNCRKPMPEEPTGWAFISWDGNTIVPGSSEITYCDECAGKVTAYLREEF